MATTNVFVPMLSAVCQPASTIRRRGASDTTVTQHDDRDQDAVSRRHARRRNRGVTRLASAGRRERVGSHGSLILGQEPLRPVSCAIIVGYDGTALGRTAVVEAGLRARPAGCVFVVHAYRSPPGYLGSPYTERRVSAARAAGKRLLEDLFSDGGLPDVEYIPELISGRPMEAIARVAAARDADAIVIGARPTGRVRTILNAVSRQRLLTPAVPVILIPEARNGPRGDGGAAADEDYRTAPIDAWW
jgi:nucleotide-binding universal stress UspA family protein